MARGAKYQTVSHGSHDGQTYYYVITEEGYVGSVTTGVELIGGGGHLTYSPDEQDLMGISTLTLAVEDTSGAIATLIDGSDDRSVGLEVYQEGTPDTLYWSGLITPVLSRKSLDRFPVEGLVIEATDGLGTLGSKRYEDILGAAATKTAHTQVISEILRDLGMGLDLRIACDWFPFVTGGAADHGQPPGQRGNG